MTEQRLEINDQYFPLFHFHASVTSQAIVWDKSLAGPIGLVAKYSLLQEHEVIKMYPLTGGQLPPTNVSNIIFITRPDLALMDLIAKNVHE